MEKLTEEFSWEKVCLPDLRQVAAEILAIPTASRVYLMQGEMGSGKTTLTGNLIRALGSVNQIQSPTYGLVHEYSSPAGPIYHFDFYRIKSDDEAMDIGFEEYLDSGHYCFIEWPEKVARLLPSLCNEISLILDDQTGRLISLKTPRQAPLL